MPARSQRRDANRPAQIDREPDDAPVGHGRSKSGPFLRATAHGAGRAHAVKHRVGGVGGRCARRERRHCQQRRPGPSHHGAPALYFGKVEGSVLKPAGTVVVMFCR